MLFASDLFAVRRGKLALPHEETKKVFLRIEERLQLRGMQVDVLNRNALSDQRQRTVNIALNDLKRMTMTVVDGDFPREIIARENLTFRRFRLSGRKNKQAFYNARLLRAMNKWEINRGKRTRWRGPASARKWLTWQTRKQAPRKHYKRYTKRQRITRLIRQFRNPKRVNSALRQVVKMGSAAIPYLWAEIIEDQPLVPRGWAVVALSEMGQQMNNIDAKTKLKTVALNASHPVLLRTWAAAGHILTAQSTKELLLLQSLLNHFPATVRPFSKRLRGLMKVGKKSLTTLLKLSTNYRLRRALAPVIMSFGPRPLVKVMYSHPDNSTRRMAAAYVASIGRKEPIKTAKMIVRALRFRPKAKLVPWAGGALFVPSIAWKKPQARALVGRLIAWMLWAEGHHKKSLQRQIHNNIRSLSLARVAGYRSPGWRMATIDRWLVIWGGVVGCRGIKRILQQQGVESISRYQSVLQQLNCN